MAERLPLLPWTQQALAAHAEARAASHAYLMRNSGVRAAVPEARGCGEYAGLL